MEQLVTIELFGQQYTFKTESEISRAREVADFIAKEVAVVEAKQASGQTSNLSRISILTIVALNIANDYFALKKSQEELLRVLSQRSSDLSEILDGFLENRHALQGESKVVQMAEPATVVEAADG